jgi:class 3 adenylate cyclase
MGRALERHDRLVRAAIASHRGVAFSTAGDSFSAAFSTPADAVGAAIDAQLSLASAAPPGTATVQVRMGIHLGVAQERGGDYFGIAVNRAARLMALAHGGQILLSLAVEQVVRDQLPSGVGLLSVGRPARRV